MINYCKTCKHEGEEIGVCSTCFYNRILEERDIPPTEYEKKPSNADRIRSMTDEELAELFANDNCGYCRIHDFCFDKGSAINCEDVWLDWLKQEAIDGETAL